MTPLIPVPYHEVNPARTAAHKWLPHLYGPVDRTRHQRYLLQFVSPVRNGRRDSVVLAAMGERLRLERLHDYFELLFEQRAVGLRVEHGRAEGLDLTGMVAASYSEDDPPSGKDVRGGEVLGQPERVPRGQHVESAAEPQTLRQPGQVRRQQDDVGDALVSLVLEVMLGHPENIVAQFVRGPGYLGRGPEHAGQPVVRVAAVVGGGTVVADALHINLPLVQGAERFDHRFTGGWIAV